MHSEKALEILEEYLRAMFCLFMDSLEGVQQFLEENLLVFEEFRRPKWV